MYSGSVPPGANKGKINEKASRKEKDKFDRSFKNPFCDAFMNLGRLHERGQLGSGVGLAWKIKHSKSYESAHQEETFTNESEGDGGERN